MPARKTKRGTPKAKSPANKGRQSSARKRSRKPVLNSSVAPHSKSKAKSSKRKTTNYDVLASNISAAVRLALPERLDSAASATVLDSFKRMRGNALIVDASSVRRVGAQGIQILLSASRTWKADGHDLAVENASDELIIAAQLLGLSHSDLSISGSLQ